MSLHRVESGAGVPAVFVHGSFGWGLDTFPDQQRLAGDYRIVLVDRVGFGGTPAREPIGWPTDTDEVAALLDELGGAHLVGQSYGAVVALLAASRRPDLVRSLVVIEPPLFGLAGDDPAVGALVSAMRPVVERAAAMDTADYVRAWGAAAMGRNASEIDQWTSAWSADDWAAADTSRRERWPGDAPVDLAVLAQLAVPKVVVAGAWPGQPQSGAPFRAVVNRLAARVGADVAVFPRSAHNPQLEEPDAFNQLLRSTWTAPLSRTAPASHG